MPFLPSFYHEKLSFWLENWRKNDKNLSSMKEKQAFEGVKRCFYCLEDRFN